MRSLLTRTACVALAVGLVLGCAGRRAKPAGQVLTVCISRLDTAGLDRQAGFVRGLRQKGPVLWFARGPVFPDREASALTDGAAPVALLNAAGIDAVLLPPAWTGFGLPRLEQLVNLSRCYLLGADLQDSTGMTLGHPFLVRRTDEATVAVTGIASDVASAGVLPQGARLAAADFSARRAAALMRQRADIVGIFLPAMDTVSGWGVDLVIGAESPEAVSLAPEPGERFAVFELRLLGGVIAGSRRVAASFDSTPPDEAVVRAVDSVAAAVESLRNATAMTLPRKLTAAELARQVARGLTAAGQADAFVYDSLPFAGGFGSGAVTNGGLVAALRDARRLAVVTLTGAQVAELRRKPGMAVEPAGAKPAAADRVLRVALTQECLARHPELARNGYGLTPQQFWTIAAGVIKSSRR